MNPNKLYLVFLLCMISFTLSAQRTISGRITDAENGSPVSGAAVFIANTSTGISTDTAGYYRLKIPGEGSYQLAVSHVGYQPVFKDIDPGKAAQTLNITLRPHEIEEVTITAKSTVRKQDIELFWSRILGKKPSKKTIYATNPEKVYFYFNTETQKLTVTCRVPLQIVNYETGYQIQCVLDHFTHNYNTDISSWQFQPLFTELEPENLKQKLRREANRKKVYQVSIANFIKSLYQNTLFENGFMLVNEVRTPNATTKFFWADPKYFLSSDSVDRSKVLHESSGTLILFSFGKPIGSKEVELLTGTKPIEKIGLFRNIMKIPDEPVHIFPDGTYKNPIHWTRVYGSNSISGLNMLLPTEYLLNAGSMAAAAFAENEPADMQKAQKSAHPLATPVLEAAKRFDRQLSVFPQEKVYLHTDKPYYLSGERIWFRAHVVDAATHVPPFVPGCVFVELFDARDSVVSRVKTGAGNSLYSGYIPIPEDTPEGDYTLRAYTPAMRQLDEDYLFMKNIRIGDPVSRFVQVHPEFDFFPDHNVGAGFSFSRIGPAGTITPESLKITVNSEKSTSLKSVNGKSGFNFKLSPDDKHRVMLLEAICEKNPYRQYIRIPVPDDDFDVSFYSEGGSALYGVAGRTAFKAMQRDGTETDVEGTVYDSRGGELTRFKTAMRGMGQFMMRQEPGETYFAVCTNSKGQSKRFDLPAARENGYLLTATWSANRLMVKILQPETQKTGDTLCLIVHTRGMVQDIRILDDTTVPIVYQKDFFTSGVSHLLLLTKDMVPVSERLVFVHNGDQAKVEGKSNRERHAVRSAVEYTVKITDEKTGEPLNGNFSVSVTDDHTVNADTAFNILTSLLLTSDLRGNIPDPAYFFRKEGRLSVYALDLLMLTQGWRRYDTERIVRNDLMYPDTLKSYGLSGTVRTVSGGRQAVEKVPVSILSMKGDFAEETVTGRDGRFYLHGGEVPDSTGFIVQTAPKTGMRNLELILDKVTYPGRTIPADASGKPDREVFARYADKAGQQYADEYGTRVRHIPEVVITAPRKKGKDYSFFYKPQDADHTITEEDIKRFPPASTGFLLRRIPNIMVNSGDPAVPLLTYGHGNASRFVKVVVAIDDVVVEGGVINDLHPSEIVQIDLVYGLGYLFSRGETPWLLSITTRLKKFTPKETPYIKYFMPLGFQKPAEFYAPKYDTPASKTKPDLRTTIHWQPSLTTDGNGKAPFNFYTADVPSTYTVVIEGMTEDGKIVYKRDKIVVE